MVIRKWIIALFVTLLLMPAMTLAQQECLFISSATAPGADGDQDLIEEIINWGYAVTVVGAVDDLPNFTQADFDYYDFAFLSETINSSNATPLRGHPLPLVTTEAWACAKPAVLGWASVQDVANQPPESILIIAETGNPLAAGFAENEEVSIISGSNVETEGVISFVPTIDVIYVASLASDDAQIVVAGVDSGIVLADDATITQNRAAVVGIHASAYDWITEDGVKMLQAAVHWVLRESETFVETASNKVPEQFELNQNYPNPFNPTTEITFSLAEKGFTTLKVYNAIGQEISTLINQDLNAGKHQVVFNAQDLPSGIYFYKLESTNAVQMKKMALMK